MTKTPITDSAPVPSSRSTGGAGNEYERHVGAACLATLLTGGMTLMLPDVVLSSVAFQTRRLGWRTDDFLLVGLDRISNRRRVAIQAKAVFYLRPSDADCADTLRAAWEDFHDRNLFDEAADRLGIITGQTGSKVARGMRLLLDTAHASSDSSDLMHRLGLPAYISRDAPDCLTTIRDLLTEHSSVKPTDDSLWRFLRVLDFAVLDFGSATSVGEALVKSLLAATCQTSGSASTDSWNALLAVAGDSAVNSRELSWKDLPQELKERHCISSSEERRTLAELKEYTGIIRSSADRRIGGIASLRRAPVVADVLANLSEHNAVVLTGEAGSGKTVVAGMAFAAIGKGGLAIAFRAESLAEPHLAASLLGAVGHLRELLRLLAVHSRKVLWIESAERLLEKPAAQREAFGDLLRSFCQAPGWKLLITCRDYSVETFRSAFLEREGVRSEVVRVPRLTDEDLDEAQHQLPTLAVPLSVPSVRELVHNPFYLDLAARLTWTSSEAAPTGELAFRDKAWREVVCREDEAFDGLPLERDRVMVELALRRARAMTPYVLAADLPPNALQRLVSDSLLVRDPNDHVRLAPAHDVYEDWALIRWLQRHYLEAAGLSKQFFEKIETHPAMRRAFRRWLREALDTDPTTADQRILQVLSNRDVETVWRDDTLASVLQSAGVAGFLTRCLPQLTANDCALLKRAVHLLQIACRKAPAGLPQNTRLNWTLLMPEGPAWDVIPVLIVAALAALKTTDIGWILRLLESSVTHEAIAPQSATAIAFLAKTLLAMAGSVSYAHRQSFTERVLRIMISVPQASESDLRRFLDRALSQERRKREERALPNLLWSHFHGHQVCRLLPDLTVRVAEDRLALASSPSERPPRDSSGHMDRIEVDDVFGFTDRFLLDFYPASAWQGPFANLLAEHPERGIDLVVRLANQACATYAADKSRIIEKPIQITLNGPDGADLVQWGNPRLWGMYRGQTVAPYALQSALMALEEWLLEKAQRGDADTLAVFSRLLRETNNVGVTAVLASVAVAYPYFFGEAALPLLTCETLFHWDFARAFDDDPHRSESGLLSGFGLDPYQTLMKQERVESRKKGHRWRHLEHLCVQLQLTPARERVLSIIDGHRAELPETEDERDRHRIWRLILHRVDTRKFVGEETGESVLWTAGPLPQDLEEFRERQTPKHREQEQRLGLLMWGLSVFSGERADTYLSSDWREKLSAIRTLPTDPEATSGSLRDSGAPHIAAVAIRDHWAELTEEELEWCTDTICQEIEDLRQFGSLIGAGISAIDGVRPSSFVIAHLVAQDSNPVRRLRALRCLAKVALHLDQHVVVSAAQGVGRFLYPVDPGRALAVVGAMLSCAEEGHEFDHRIRKTPWTEREALKDAFEVELFDRLCSTIESGEPVDEAKLLNVDYSYFPHLKILSPFLRLFAESPNDPLACSFYERIAALVATSWGADRRRRRAISPSSEDGDSELNHEVLYDVHGTLASFALIAPEATALALMMPLVTASGRQPREAAEFVKLLVYQEDRLHTIERFWTLWQLFADAYVESGLGVNADDERNESGELLDALLLGIHWGADTHEWKPLRGHGSRVQGFVRRLPATSRAISRFATLLRRFSSEFLPSALTVLAEKFETSAGAGATVELLGRFALSELEEAVGGLVYAGAMEIRQDPNLRRATVTILEAMVEAGSAAAFRIRDDFVTPLRG